MSHCVPDWGRQDSLAERLRLDSSYEVRARFTDPSEQQRIVNSLGARFAYDVTPKLRTGVEYRLVLEDFTQQNRFDVEHVAKLTTTYNFSRDVFLNGFFSYLFGSSSDDSIDINNLSFGLNIGINLPLF